MSTESKKLLVIPYYPESKIKEMKFVILGAGTVKFTIYNLKTIENIMQFSYDLSDSVNIFSHSNFEELNTLNKSDNIALVLQAQSTTVQNENTKMKVLSVFTSM